MVQDSIADSERSEEVLVELEEHHSGIRERIDIAAAAWRQYCHQFLYVESLPHACQHLIVSLDDYIPHEWVDAPTDEAADETTPEETTPEETP